MTIYFQDRRDSRYHELNDDTPARTKDWMGLLQDLKDDGSDIEVFMGTGWVPGWLPGTPKTYIFQVECVSFEEEAVVHGAIHDGLIKYHGARNSQLPWHKIIPPSKQCFNLPNETYLVIAREDRLPDGEKGRYTLATRRVFETEAAATDYAVGISSSREPLVVPGCYNQLRTK